MEGAHDVKLGRLQNRDLDSPGDLDRPIGVGPVAGLESRRSMRGESGVRDVR